MSGNSFGQLFKITTFGESHGEGLGVVIDGFPAGFEITAEEIQIELDRRKPGQSKITTDRNERDQVKILSGVFEGKTTGTPILMICFNTDAQSQDYLQSKDLYRPSHADFTYTQKYGFRDWRGSGRASARETLARVAAGALAKKYLKQKLGIEFLSYVEQVENIVANIEQETLSLEKIESNIVRCPDPIAAQKMITLIEEVKNQGDSVGGVIAGIIKNLPVGLGEPVFDKLPADLGKAMLSINAVKGFEFGSGFAGTSMRGSQHNDSFYLENNQVKTKTNHAGGCLGGISNGQDINFRVAIKPVATIAKAQKTLNTELEEIEFSAQGRHDPCVLPRAVAIVDAMAAIVIMDHYLRFRAVA